MRKKLFAAFGIALVVVALFSASLAVSPQSGDGRAQQDLADTVMTSRLGEVTYEYRSAKTGRVYIPAPPASTNKTSMVEIDSEMRVTIRPQTNVYVIVTLSIELGVTTSGLGVGVLAYIDKSRMYPSVTGSSYLAGWVSHPRTAYIGQFSQLETWTFTWQRSAGRGTHTIYFRWAVSSSVGKVWADFYSIEVSAVRVNP